MKYILDGRHPVPCDDLLQWCQWMDTADIQVASTHICEDVFVSTVFLGINYNCGGNGPPILFETLVFGVDLDQQMCRYATWEEAETGHYGFVEAARNRLRRDANE